MKITHPLQHGSRPEFGDRNTEDLWRKKRKQQARTQRCRWAVAPWCSVLLPDGSRLGEGEEVTEATFEGATFTPSRIVHDLVVAEILVEGERREEEGPEAA